MDEATYRMTFNKYYKHLHIFSLRYVDASSAHDIVQDAFLKLWERSKEYNDENHIRKYLYKSVYHLCLNHLKHNSCVDKFRNKMLQEIDLSTDINFETDHAEIDLLVSIFEAINNLPEKCREIFEMTYLDKMSTQEVANKLLITQNTIKTQKMRAKEALRKALERCIPEP